MAFRVAFVRFVGPLPSAKVSGLAAIPVGARGIAGKNLYVPDPNKPKPFPYWKRDYAHLWKVFDKTTTRLDENSKLICVEGAHAIGKTKFAAELAEELNMVHLEYPRMDDYFINPYGFDLRKLAEHFPDKLKPYDEKDFARNPLGPIEGCADRMHILIYKLKYLTHMMAIRHILNTGQGVVMEGSIFSDYAHFEAAFNQGWIHPSTRRVYKDMQNRSLHHLLRPNLIIYLDAPVDVVQSNIAARGNEWDKNSPVWTNKAYLEDIYNQMKRKYLKEMQTHCRVLAYDWSKPGDAEIVVEDIEAINFDFIEYFEPQQSDWRFVNEEGASKIRTEYTTMEHVIRRLNAFCDLPSQFDAEHLWLENDDVVQYDDVIQYTESERFAVGFNKKLGDSGFWWKNDGYHSFNGQGLYNIGVFHGPRSHSIALPEVDGIDLEDIKAARAAGQSNVVYSHNRKVLNF